MAIPKIIHQTWKNPADLPADLALLVERVAALHPGWEHRIYGDDECRAAVERIFPAMLPLYDASAPIQRADIFRIVVVWGDGGFYLDADVYLRLPLDDLCEFRAVFGEELSLSAEDTVRRGLRSPLRIGNFVFGSEPGHPLLLRIIEGMALRTGREITVEDDIIQSTGPDLVTAVYWENSGEMTDVVVIPNKDRICRICRTLSCGFGNYAAHVHVGSWRWQDPLRNTGVKPPAVPPPAEADIDALLREVALRKSAERNPYGDMLLLDIYKGNPPFDGLSTVYERMAAVLPRAVDTSGMSGKKVLTAFMPGHCERGLSAENKNAIYTTFETSKIPSWWVRAINDHYKICIVPHPYVKEAFLASGVEAPVEIVQQGYTRHKRLRETARGTEKGIFRIGFLGVPYARKNLFRLYQACVDLANEIPGLRLAVHSSVMFDNLYSREIHLMANSPFVEWTQGTLDAEGTSDWYSRLSCYVFPSSGEGWSFTPRESLYLGVPTVITDIPVHDELVNSGYYKVIPVSGTEEVELGGEICGEWSKIAVSDIKAALLDVHSRYGHYFVTAMKGAAWIENRWTNESSQQRVLELMRSL